MKTGKRLAAAIGAMAVCCVLAACGGAVSMAETEHVITVNATAQVKVEPDKASFNVNVVTQGATAEEASSANAEPVEAVVAALKEAGVSDADIQTVYTDLYPQYGMAEEPQVDGAYDGAYIAYGGNDIVGYEMRTSIQVSGVDIDMVAELMGACISAGATGVDGPQYYVSSYDEAYAEALTQAIAASREKAQVMASAAGVTLGRVVNITEGYSYSGMRYAAAETAMDAGAGTNDAMAKVADIVPGQVTVEAQVTVSYAI